MSERIPSSEEVFFALQRVKDWCQFAVDKVGDDKDPPNVYWGHIEAAPGLDIYGGYPLMFDDCAATDRGGDDLDDEIFDDKIYDEDRAEHPHLFTGEPCDCGWSGIEAALKAIGVSPRDLDERVTDDEPRGEGEK